MIPLGMSGVGKVVCLALMLSLVRESFTSAETSYIRIG